MAKRMLKFNLLMQTLFLALGVVWSSEGMAETVRYVSDQLIITLREEAGDRSSIIRTLSTGTRLEVLEEQDAFSRVVTETGEEGWVRTQYLVDQPVASAQLKESNDKLARFERENGTLRQDLTKFKQENKTLQQRIDELTKDNKRLTDENLNISRAAARPIELEKENQQLTQESTAMKSELQTLKSEYGSLKKGIEQRWFLAGGGVLFIGIVLGLLLPRLRVRRQSDWG